ncbi:hypothetical protein ACS0TY_029252 [Phlomoides rotata]
MWTSSFHKKGFMAVTAHHIDNNWKLHSRIIGFIFVPCPHTSDVLCEALLECFLEWNIDRKISTVTVDNCSTNDAMLNMLVQKLPDDALLLGGKLIHMRCCAHILNLIVEDGLDVIQGAIDNIRDSVAYWSGTQKRWDKFEEAARQVRVTITKKLVLDCKTRWNSTFFMLQTALDYKNIFARLKFREAKYTCCPSEDEWKMTNEICGKLKLFYDATELFSGTKYPTANLYFPNVCDIKLSLVDWSVCGVEIIEKMAEKMIVKFDKYWSYVNGIMGVAIILDPRYKADLLEYYFGKIYVYDAELEVERILTLCRELVEQYEKEYQKTDGHKNGLTEANEVVGVASMSDFLTYASKKKRKPVRSELEQYLEKGILPPSASDFDLLTWWRLNKSKYPILSRIAKDILAIPVSIVASESAFSTSGRLIGPHRSRLHTKTIEALMCAQSWLSTEMNDAHAKESVFYDSDADENEIME